MLRDKDVLTVHILEQMIELGRKLVHVPSDSSFSDVCIVLGRGSGTKQSLYEGTVIDCSDDVKTEEFERAFLKTWYRKRRKLNAWRRPNEEPGSGRASVSGAQPAGGRRTVEGLAGAAAAGRRPVPNEAAAAQPAVAAAVRNDGRSQSAGGSGTSGPSGAAVAGADLGSRPPFTPNTDDMIQGLRSKPLAEKQFSRNQENNILAYMGLQDVAGLKRADVKAVFSLVSEHLARMSKGKAVKDRLGWARAVPPALLNSRWTTDSNLAVVGTDLYPPWHTGMPSGHTQRAYALLVAATVSDYWLWHIHQVFRTGTTFVPRVVGADGQLSDIRIHPLRRRVAGGPSQSTQGSERRGGLVPRRNGTSIKTAIRKIGAERSRAPGRRRSGITNVLLPKGGPRPKAKRQVAKPPSAPSSTSSSSPPCSPKSSLPPALSAAARSGSFIRRPPGLPRTRAPQQPAGPLRSPSRPPSRAPPLPDPAFKTTIRNLALDRARDPVRVLALQRQAVPVEQRAVSLAPVVLPAAEVERVQMTEREITTLLPEAVIQRCHELLGGNCNLDGVVSASPVHAVSVTVGDDEAFHVTAYILAHMSAVHSFNNNVSRAREAWVSLGRSAVSPYAFPPGLGPIFSPLVSASAAAAYVQLRLGGTRTGDVLWKFFDTASGVSGAQSSDKVYGGVSVNSAEALRAVCTTWLTSAVVNACLIETRLLVGSARTYVLLVEQASSLHSYGRGTVDEAVALKAAEEVAGEVGDSTAVVMVINIENSHWIAAKIETISLCITIFDTLRGTSAAKSTAVARLQLLCDAMDIRAGRDPHAWDVKHDWSWHQTDDYNCGVFASARVYCCALGYESSTSVPVDLLRLALVRYILLRGEGYAQARVGARDAGPTLSPIEK